MKRILILAMLLGSLAFPATVLGFHHGDLPATDCHAAAAISPSNNNGMAKEALIAHNPHGIPLAPVDIPGEGPGGAAGGENCASGQTD